VLVFPAILYVAFASKLSYDLSCRAMLIFFAVFSLVVNVKCIPVVASWFEYNDPNNWLNNIWTLLSVVFTVISTALIAWRLLGARTARLALHATGQAARARKVALILTESALLYTASGIIFAALNIADPEGNLFVSNLFFTIFMDMAVRAESAAGSKCITDTWLVLESGYHDPPCGSALVIPWRNAASRHTPTSR
jgi:hypothetical protein